MAKTTSRGRRGDKKRKAEDADIKDDVRFVDGSDDEPQETTKDKSEPSEQSAFFGIVDRVELEYFKQAESTLAANAFSGSEEREAFIAGVLDEAAGKELKLVTNQICSKLVERLVLNATPPQLMALFKAFSGHFAGLSKHKYSSHCVETLLVRAAALVDKEMATPDLMELYKTDKADDDNTDDTDQVYVSMETLFIYMVNELTPQLNELPAHQYGSHVLRLILLILSGSTLPSTTAKSALRSKKSKIARKMISIKDNHEFEQAYKVPSSFKSTLTDLVTKLTANLDSTKARELSINKLSSPVMQLVVKLECGDKDLMAASGATKKLVNLSKSAEAESSEESYIEFLLSDPVGLYFFESLVEALPVPAVLRLYRLYMSPRIAKLVKRDSANYIVPALLKRLPKAESEELIDAVIPEIDVLVNSNNYVILRAVLQASGASHHKEAELTKAINDKYNSKSSGFLEKLMQFEGSTLGQSKDGDWPTNEEMNRALFAEALVSFSPNFLKDVSLGFVQLPKEKLLEVARHSVFSHVLESCLVPEADIVVRRRLMNSFTGSVADLACNAYGSHLIDRCWQYTFKIKFLRERIAEELVAATEAVKHSTYGRLVWKNWNLDKYVRKRHEWWRLVKDQEDKIAETLGQSRQDVEAKQAPKVKENDSKGSFKGRDFKGPREFKGPRDFKGRSERPKPYDRPQRSH